MTQRCAGILLTGGGSRRLGRDKATLPFGAGTLASRAAAVLAEVCDPVVEAGPGVSGLPAVREEPAGAGPLAALFTAVDALAITGPVLLFACDMPRVPVELVRLVAHWPGPGSAVPTVAGRAQFACARWSPHAVAHARASADGSLRSLAAAGDATYLDEPVWSAVAGADAFADVDTPADAARLDSLDP